MKNCIDCQKELSRTDAKRCKICYAKIGYKGKNNPNYRHGRNCKNAKHLCLDCGKSIDKQGRSIRCYRCSAPLRDRKGFKHSIKTKKLIGFKSAKKFTKQYLQNLRVKNNGNKKRDTNGYILIKSYGHPDRNSHNDMLEHRLKAEKKLKRRLTKHEIVHHIDCDKTNNKFINLYIYPNRSKHSSGHWSLHQIVPILLQSKVIKFKNGVYMFNKKEAKVVAKGEV